MKLRTVIATTAAFVAGLAIGTVWAAVVEWWEMNEEH